MVVRVSAMASVPVTGWTNWSHELLTIPARLWRTRQPLQLFRLYKDNLADFARAEQRLSKAGCPAQAP